MAELPLGTATLPTPDAAPLVVPLQDGHAYDVVAVAPDDPSCGANDPTILGCQRWRSTAPDVGGVGPDVPIAVG